LATYQLQITHSPRNVFFGNAFRTIVSLELPPLTANLEEKLDPNSRNDTYNNS
jgi:hypothetical protein